jgi:hypothetical protein
MAIKHPKLYIVSLLVAFDSGAGLAAGTVLSKKIPIPEDYDMMKGIGIAGVSIAAEPNLQIGFRKNASEVVERTHADMLAVSTAVPPNQRLLMINEPIKRDNNLEVVCETTAAVAAAQTLQFNVVVALTNEAAYYEWLNREERLKLVEH